MIPSEAFCFIFLSRFIFWRGNVLFDRFTSHEYDQLQQQKKDERRPNDADHKWNQSGRIYFAYLNRMFLGSYTCEDSDQPRGLISIQSIGFPGTRQINESDSVDAQPGLSLRCEQMSESIYSHVGAHWKVIVPIVIKQDDRHVLIW